MIQKSMRDVRKILRHQRSCQEESQHIGEGRHSRRFSHSLKRERLKPVVYEYIEILTI